MKRYHVNVIALRLETIEAMLKTLSTSDALNKTVDENFTAAAKSVLLGLKSCCETLESEKTLLLQIDSAVGSIDKFSLKLLPIALAPQLKAIVDGVHHSLNEKKFLLLTDEEAKFHGNPDVFGESFKEKYSAKALRDAVCAGNCYATNQHTACVYHCMRVAEYG